MYIVAAKVGKLIEEEVGDAFGVIFDGWTRGSTHYVAIFCAYMLRGDFCRRLLSILPVVEKSQTADVHIELFKRVLDVYNKTTSIILFVVGDNCTTNRSIANKLSVPLVGCASHRLNLAVQAYLKQYEQELDELNALMVQLRHPNNSAELAKFMDLRPIKTNVTRWSSTREMASRYNEIRGDIRKVEAVEYFIPTAFIHRNLVALNEDLCVFDSACKKLQDEETSMADTRLLFTSLLDRYPDLGTHLSPTSKIVHSPNFENAAIKVANGTPLTAHEAKTVAKFVTNGRSFIGEKRKRSEAPDFATTILLEGTAARRTGRSSAVYNSLLMKIPPTSNACDRLFSQTKLILTHKEEDSLMLILRC